MLFQLEISKSTGDKARPSKTEAAIMLPELKDPCSTRYAPSPKMPDCKSMRA